MININLAKQIAYENGLSRGIYWLYPPPKVWKNIPFEEIKKYWRKFIKTKQFIADLHINIPFTKKEIKFCDYGHIFETNPSVYDEYLKCLKNEIEFIIADNKINFMRLFFTGGSSTILSPKQIEFVFNIVLKNCNFNSPDKIIEIDHCQPSLSSIRTFVNHGVNKAIIGVQSLDPSLSKILKWKYTKSKLYKTVEMLRKEGINDIRINLMFGFKGQTIKSFEKDLKYIISLSPSCIVLQPFTPAPFPPLSVYDSNKHKLLVTMRNKDIVNRYKMYKIAKEVISSFHLSADTTKEWTSSIGNNSFLSLGIGSFSRIHSKIIYKIDENLKSYFSKWQNRILPNIIGYKMDLDLEMRSYIIKELECTGKIDLKEFETLFKTSFKDKFKNALILLKNNNLIKEKGNNIYISRDDSILLNVIASKFFYDKSVYKCYNFSNDLIDLIDLLQLYIF
jgi:oxygen-independent coproporphyrinogen-3 oxidase